MNSALAYALHYTRYKPPRLRAWAILNKMAKCIRCGDDALTGARICPTCLCNWDDMRTTVFNALQDKYGKLNSQNHKFFIKETKRLERIWRKDKGKFEQEIGAFA